MLLLLVSIYVYAPLHPVCIRQLLQTGGMQPEWSLLIPIWLLSRIIGHVKIEVKICIIYCRQNRKMFLLVTANSVEEGAIFPYPIFSGFQPIRGN